MRVTVALAAVGDRNCRLRAQEIMPFGKSDKNRAGRLRVDSTVDGGLARLEGQLARMICGVSPIHQDLVGVHDRFDLCGDTKAQEDRDGLSNISGFMGCSFPSSPIVWLDEAGRAGTLPAWIMYWRS